MNDDQFRKTSCPRPEGSRSTTFVVTGTIVLLLIAGVGFQVWRAQPGEAGEQANGNASLSDAPRYVARVNGQLITFDELAQECVDVHGKDVLDNLINRIVIQQACKERGIEVAGREVHQEVIRLAKRFGLDRDTWFKMIEGERGLSPVQYERDIIWPMLALKKLAGREVRITEQDLDQAYEDNFGEKVKARMIVLDNQRRAMQLWEQLRKAPETFEEMAREHSVDPNTRALGGTIPPIRRYSGHEGLRAAAFKMRRPGEISGVIQLTPNRFAILQFDGRTERVDHDAKAVRVQLQTELMEQEVQKLVADTFQDIKNVARVDNYITGESTGQIQRVSAERLNSTTDDSQPSRKGVRTADGTKPTRPRSR